MKRLEGANGGWIPIDASESADIQELNKMSQEPHQESSTLPENLPGDVEISNEGSSEEITQPVYLVPINNNTATGTGKSSGRTHYPQ